MLMPGVPSNSLRKYPGEFRSNDLSYFFHPFWRYMIEAAGWQDRAEELNPWVDLGWRVDYTDTGHSHMLCQKGYISLVLMKMMMIGDWLII